MEGYSMNYYSRERLGPKQSLTKEGWLLCADTPIARTGQMVYGDGEVPLPAGPDGVILVDRFPEDVFRPETIASFNGKDVVDEHPEEDVTPRNWRSLTAGVVLNVRRGKGAEDDLMLADLIIKDPDVIDSVRHGKREVSCGYDADYIQALDAAGSPILGRGKQINILGNHVALVESGRCGPRCAIGDEKTVKENSRMTWLEKIKAAFKAKDEAALEAALAEAPKDNTQQVHVHLAPTLDAKKDDEEEEDEKDTKTMDAIAADVKKVADTVDSLDKRLKKVEDAVDKKDDEEEEEEEDKTKDEEILGNLEFEAPPGTGDGIAAKARDSALLEDSFRETVSLAEIIAPGVQVPTFDKKMEPKKTFDAMCRFRRTVLDLAAAKPELRSYMDNLSNGKDYKTFDCGQIRTLFKAVGNHQKTLNNMAAARDTSHAAHHSGGGSGPVSTIQTPADLNKKMAEFYKH